MIKSLLMSIQVLDLVYCFAHSLFQAHSVKLWTVVVESHGPAWCFLIAYCCSWLKAC
jgi:hypothetical protein